MKHTGESKYILNDYLNTSVTSMAYAAITGFQTAPHSCALSSH
jgi:hypothetical protein